MTVKVNWREPGGSLDSDLSYGYNEAPKSFFLAPKAAGISEEVVIPSIHANAIINNGMSHESGAPMMFIWGRADYLDVFDVPHFVEWCFRIRFDRHDGQRLIVRFILHGGHNRSDEDNQKRRTV